MERERNLQKTYEKLPGNPIRLLVNLETKIGQTKVRKFSGIKLLKKAVKKVNKKVSGHTYGQIRKQIQTNGTTVNKNKSSEVRIYK